MLAGAAVLIATLRIVATYPVFNHTIDEPAHIACGMEWLAKGTYTLEPQHPPLARIFSALGPFLAGERSQGRRTIYNDGAAILYHNGKYERNLTLARMGTLPFFWLACVVIYLAARALVREGASGARGHFVHAVAADPGPRIAGDHRYGADRHARLGAVRAGRVGGTSVAGLGLGAIMGFCCALAFLSKFSSLAFLPACVGAMLAWR